MDQAMHCDELLLLATPHAPVAKTGRPTFNLATMQRIHCLQQWFGLSDLGVEQALFEAGASAQTKVEHPFWVIKRQFGHAKVRYHGLKKIRHNSSHCFRSPRSG
jgi:hypothetical protein